jgi:hypothetical protein
VKRTLRDHRIGLEGSFILQDLILLICYVVDYLGSYLRLENPRNLTFRVKPSKKALN